MRDIRYVIEYFACSYSLFIHTRTHVFPTTTQTFVRSAVLVQLFELHPACVGETRVVFILSKLTAREAANSAVGSSQLVAPLLSDQFRTSACRAPPRSCSRMLARPRRPHRRLQAVPGADAAFCVLALVASTHGAVRVLEQAVCAAVGAVALRVDVDARSGISRVYLDFCRYTRVLPASCSRTCICIYYSYHEWQT